MAFFARSSSASSCFIPWVTGRLLTYDAHLHTDEGLRESTLGLKCKWRKTEAKPLGVMMLSKRRIKRNEEETHFETPKK